MHYVSRHGYVQAGCGCYAQGLIALAPPITMYVSILNRQSCGETGGAARRRRRIRTALSPSPEHSVVFSKRHAGSIADRSVAADS
jgi:hypothetical protein